MWYMRNRIYFDLDLHSGDRVMLISYEELVSDPAGTVRRLCSFINARYVCDMEKNVHNGSIGKSTPPKINDQILQDCQQLTEQLHRAKQAIPQVVNS